MTWVYAPEALAAALEDAGFDVDRSKATLPGGGGSLTARRDRGTATWVLTIDAGGRLKAVYTRLSEESPSESLDVAGQSLRAVTEVTRATTVAGQLESPDRLAMVIAAIEERFGRAGDEGGTREPARRAWWKRW